MTLGRTGEKLVLHQITVQSIDKHTALVVLYNMLVS